MHKKERRVKLWRKKVNIFAYFGLERGGGDSVLHVVKYCTGRSCHFPIAVAGRSTASIVLTA
jgi:hypothetical protein